MCFFPGGHPQGPQVSPSPRAKQLAQYIKVLGFAQLFLAMLLFLSGSWVNGLLCILGATIGYCTTSKTEFEVQKVRCYVFLFAYLCFMAISSACLALGNVLQLKQLPQWQLAIRYSTLSASPIVYMISTIIGTMLYNDLRRTANDHTREIGGGQGGQGPPGGQARSQPSTWSGVGRSWGGGQSAYGNSGNSGNSGYNWGSGRAVGTGQSSSSGFAAPGNVAPPRGPGYANQSETKTGFRAFSGKGHKLVE